MANRFTRIVFISCVLCQINYATAVSFKIEPHIPQGFKNLEKIKKINLIDLYYKHTLLGNFIAEYDKDGIRFINPYKIVNKLQGIQPKYKKNIIAFLSKRSTINDQYLCNENSKKKCIAFPFYRNGIVFDYVAHKAYLYIEKKYITKVIKKTEYYKTSSYNLSYNNSISGITSGANQDHTQAYNITNNSLLGYKNNYLYSTIRYRNTVLDNKSIIQANSFNINHQTKTKLLSAGILSSNGGDFIPSMTLLAATVGSSLNNYAHKNKLYTNPIGIYLNVPSQVLVYKNNELIYSDFYYAGYNTINTSQFPSGMYTVTLLIKQTNGAELTETRFITVLQSLPPYGIPQYHMYIGKVLLASSTEENIFFPRFSNILIYQADYAKRIKDNVAMRGVIIGGDDDFYAETTLQWIKNHMTTSVSGLLGSEKTSGLSSNVLFTVKKIYINMGLRYIWSQFNPARYDFYPSGTDINYTYNGFDPFNGDSHEYYGTVGLYGLGGNINLSLSQNQQQGIDKNTIKSISYSRRFSVKHDISLYFNITGTESSNYKSILASLGFSGSKNDWRSQGNLTYNYYPDTNNSSLIKNLSIAKQKYDKTNHGYEINARVNQQSQSTIMGLSYLNKRKYWNGMASVQYSNNPDTIFYNGSFSTGFTLASGHLFVSNQNFGGAGAIIKTISHPDNKGDFYIYQNNSIVAKVAVNSSVFIPLQPYTNIAIKIKPDTSNHEFFSFDQNTKNIVSGIGNTPVISWHIEREYIVFTTLVDENSLPLRNKVFFINKVPYFTDSNGFIQMQITQSIKKLKIRLKKKSYCYVTMPNLNKNKTYIILNKLVCRS